MRGINTQYQEWYHITYSIGVTIVILVVYWYLVGTTKRNESLYTQVIIWVNAIQIPY